METLRDKLLDIISCALPDCKEVLEFCEADEDGFGDMLTKVMDCIVNHITEEE